VVFLDTNVIVYAATGQKAAPEKWAKAVAIMQSEVFAVSAQVLAEFVNVTRRRIVPPLPESEIEVWLDRLSQRPLLAIDAAVVRRGREISAEHGLNYYDGAILAAAERLGCDAVLSEDMTDGRAYGGVTVRNPFRDS
jgi:predicted nucleic acid-binding protein